MIQSRFENPYRPLFLIGMINGIIAAGLWILFQVQFLSQYPRVGHGLLMFFGFIGAFVTGFLMTAIPKMTRTNPASAIELFLAMSFPILMPFFVLSPNVISVLVLLQVLFLISYLIRRFWVHKMIPFEGFLFVPFAFLIMIFALSLFWMTKNPRHVFIGAEAFILNLICGIGSRLIPAISRLPQAVMPDQQQAQKKYLRYLFSALILNFSFVLEFNGNTQEALLLRGAYLLFHAFYYFRIWQAPLVRTYLGWGLKISALLLGSGYLAAVEYSAQALACLHITYLGGFALLTILIASRVSLAHNGTGTDYELLPEITLPFIFPILIAVILRVLAGANALSFEALSAAVFMISGLILWYALIGGRGLQGFFK